jgi:hypothetical protein
MTNPLVQECPLSWQRRGRGATKELLKPGLTAEVFKLGPRISRVARLMALALRFERLVQSGEVKDYAHMARLGRVSRARISQIMNLLHLAPDLQERLLFFTRPLRGRDPMHLARLQPIAVVLNWRTQRQLWRERVSYNDETR